MVFESFIYPKIAEDKPWLTFFYGIAYSTFAIFLAHYIFPQYSSLALVFFTTFLFVPLFYKTMIYEEEKDVSGYEDEKSLLKQHSKSIIFFIFLTTGLIISFAFWYLIFSNFSVWSINSEQIYSSQIQTINQINGRVTGLATGHSFSLFGSIFQNNLRVMIFCIVFSFIFGAGAIFILTWNASVIGVALGKYIAAIIPASANPTVAYAKATSCGFLRYFIHGIPEVAGYFIAGLAGGIFSAAIIKHNLGTKDFEKIMFDVALLIIIAISVIFVASLIEVYVTPLIMCRVNLL